ncbi:MAG TPA: hypothetical protein VFO58_22345 [Vicinamibacterales bacterium]|nr:hypothetical protein [Vicinamibacterales bacterium]
MREDDRDRAVDRLLRDSLKAQALTPAPKACVDGETLSAWTSGSLRAERARDVERHLSDCTRCQALLAMFLRSMPEEPDVHPFWWRARLRWFVPLATAATAAAIWLAIPVASPTRPARDQAQQLERPEAAATAALDQAADQEPPARLAKQEPPARPPEAPSGTVAPADVGNRVAEERQETFSRESRLESSTRALGRQARADAGKEAAAVAQPRSVTGLEATEIEIPGPGVRWRIRAGRVVERSTSGGAAWDGVVIPVGPDALTAGSAVSSTVCWLVGRGGTVYITADGVQFVRVAFPEAADLVAVRAIDERSATVTAADGRSWRTTDRGQSWTGVGR